MTTRWISLGVRQKRKQGLSLTHRPEAPDDGEQMVLLINVVFLLMVFFLLAGSISKRDDLPIEPPESSSERQRTAEALQLAMMSDGVLLADGSVTTLEEIPALLAAQFGGDGQTGEPRLIRVEIRADAGLGMGRLKPVLNALQIAGAEEVKLLTRLP